MYVDWRPSSEPEPLIKTSGGKAMDVNQQTIAAMHAITISREYGSGGGEIAARLARRLGWQLVDHALVERVASELGTSVEEAEVHDEQCEGFIVQLANSMQYLYPAYTASAPPEAFLSDEAVY